MSEHQSARRSHRMDTADQPSRLQNAFQNDDSLNQPDDSAYAEGNEESLAVDPPVFDTPSRRRREHPTLRVFRPSDIRQHEKGHKGNNIIAYESDDERVDAAPDKRLKTVNGHARNPFAATSRENSGKTLVIARPFKSPEQPRNGLTSRSRLHQPPKASVIVLDPSSDPPEADMDEVGLVPVPPRSRSGGDHRHPSQKPRLAGGKRHEVVPEMFRKPRVDEKTCAVLGNRASGPKYGRRAV